MYVCTYKKYKLILVAKTKKIYLYVYMQGRRRRHKYVLVHLLSLVDLGVFFFSLMLLTN